MTRADPIPDVSEATAEELACEYRRKHDTDVIFFNAPVDDYGFGHLIDLCENRNEFSSNAMLILLTYGGSAELAYKMARFFQDNYDNFSVVIPRHCKSAGTILVIGAHDIIMSPHGELGPLDVQVLKEDEFLERRSGATVVSALEMLKEKSFEMFDWFMINVKARSGGAITFRTSADISTSLVTGLLKEISGKIDPNYLGDMNRDMRIAFEYGKRLAKIGGNIEDDRIHRLVYEYPSHEFVIDRREASELFHRVRGPDDDLLRIIAALGNRCAPPRIYREDDEYDIALLSTDAPILDDAGGENGMVPSSAQREEKDDRDEEAGKADPRRSRAKNRSADRECVHGERKTEPPGAEPSLADR